MNKQSRKAERPGLRLACLQLMQQLHSGGGSLTALLPAAQARVDAREQAQLQAWCYGYARFAGELSGLADQLLQKPLKSRDMDVYLLLQLGLFQLRHTPLAPHAAVDETVKVAGQLKKPWASGLINAVLRNYQRRSAELEGALQDHQRFSHPPWLLARLQADWPQRWQSICEENNRQAPMTLRVNRQQTSVGDYRQRLQAAGIPAEPVPRAVDALQLASPVGIQQLPGFDTGEVSVQDAAAQLAADYLERYGRAGGRLLDACAAPGGKTAHALERGQVACVMALDKDADRLQRVSETLHRLQLADVAELHAVDAAKLSRWWDGQPFNAILLDAPCSGTGVIRRHPDIKLLRRDSDILPLVALQAKLLDSLWSTLAPGGVLLYATCSVLKCENERQVQDFLQRTDDAVLAEEVCQILPGEQSMDGFFYAPLIKRCELT